jgi:hypothetical protein
MWLTIQWQCTQFFNMRDTKMCSVQFSGRQCMCTHLGQILCNYEFSCIHIVVASFWVICRDLSILHYIVQHTTWQPCTLSRGKQYALLIQSHPVLFFALEELSRTFWSRGHAVRSELASLRHVTWIQTPRMWGCVAQLSATNFLFEAVVPVTTQILCEAVVPSDNAHLFVKPLFPVTTQVCCEAVFYL